MALPVTIPNEFANATASIPLSQLDTNFTTLANAVNGISSGSETLANASVTVLTASTANVTTLNTSGQVVFNDAGADVDFRVEGDTDANLLFVDASTDRVGIGTSTPSQKFTVNGIIASARSGSTAALVNLSNDNNSWNLTTGTSTAQFRIDNNLLGTALTIDSSNNLLVGKTAEDLGVAGFQVRGAAAALGLVQITRNASDCLQVNRLTDDGDLVKFLQDSLVEGSISVSGGTVSYNPFLGSHAGALADWSKPEIKIGTVMDTIDELLEYKVVVIDVQEQVPAKEAVMDEEGNQVEPAQEVTTQTVQKRISYNGNGAVGSSATVEYEGQEYTGTIQHEREEPLSFNKHLKVKVNDTTSSKAVFGVFVGWNNDSNNDGGVYNDMLVGAVGNYVIRMAAGQDPQIGDLVEADGNGCAVVQDDDIIRTKTIAKVTSTIKQVTYDDGSFLVTCVLYCG